MGNIIRFQLCYMGISIQCYGYFTDNVTLDWLPLYACGHMGHCQNCRKCIWMSKCSLLKFNVCSRSWLEFLTQNHGKYVWISNTSHRAHARCFAHGKVSQVATLPTTLVSYQQWGTSSQDILCCYIAFGNRETKLASCQLYPNMNPSIPKPNPSCLLSWKMV